MRRILSAFAFLVLSIAPAFATIPVALSPSCPASTAFFARASSNVAAALAANAPGVLTWESAVDTLICGQVSGGTFAAKDVEYLMVAPTAALAEMNLVSSNYTLAPQASVGFTANAGMTGAANATGYADTGYKPSSGQMTASSALMGVCVLNSRTTLNSTPFVAEIGLAASSPVNDYGMNILTGTTTGQASFFGIQANSSVIFSAASLPSTQGGFWVSHTGPSTFSAIVNGVNAGTGSVIAVSPSALNDFYIFGTDVDGTLSAGKGIADTIGAVVLGAGETDAQVIADNTLLNNALHSMGVSGCDGQGPPVVGFAAPIGPAPSNTLPPQIIGEDFATGVAPISLVADPGQWANAPTSFAYNWHAVGGPSLGTNSSLSVAASAVMGQALEVDVTATGAGGSTTMTSHWFGPIEASAPVAPVALETIASPTLALPVSPANFLQDGHAIFPGCVIPPVSPNTDPAHVWVFDPILGKTKDAGATGHAASPFKDASALFNTMAGYTGGPLFGSTIPAGDTILVEDGDATHPVGDIDATTAFYSTSDGTQAGTPKFTWIMTDPAAASNAVLHSVLFNAGGAFFLFKNVNVEQFKENGRYPISVGPGSGTPAHDIIFEGVNVSPWLGHSNDPWLPSPSPTSGGTSDGTVLTASPVASSQDAFKNNGTASIHSATINVSTIPPIGFYVWAPGYYQTAAIAVGEGGIPNGSKVAAVNGLTSLVPTNLFVSTISQLPATAAANSVAELFPSDGTTHLAHWTGTTWVDLGVLNETLAPCDPVADAASGCPTTSFPGLSGSGHDNVPGCDPVVITGTGGCPAGTPPAWAGTTRALTNETMSYSERMNIIPAGSWNSSDWAEAATSGFHLNGGINTAGSVDPAHPNLLTGGSCYSIKDSTVRNLFNAVSITGSTNSIIYNNKIKWYSADGVDVYTDHRVWAIHNWVSDPVMTWAHQDALQYASIDGASSGSHWAIFYGNAAIENEIIERTDLTNYFPKFEQGINTTDNIWDETYIADNLVNVTSNGIGIDGKFNAVVNNDMITQKAVVSSQTKVGDHTALNSMMSNNVGVGIDRDNSIPNYCALSGGDGVSALTNISIPFLPIGLASNASVYCNLANGAADDSSAGPFSGGSIWTQTDFRSGAAGASSLFASYHPVDPPLNPAPGWGIGGAPVASPCIIGEFPTGNGACTGGVGVLDLHPNASFSSTPNSGYTAQVIAMGNIPQTGAIGDKVILGADAFCSNGTSICGGIGGPFVNLTFPAGVYTRVAAGTTMAAYGSVASPFAPNNTLFTPGIAGKGTDLGAQMPIADHAGNPLTSPPSIGAYR